MFIACATNRDFAEMAGVMLRSVVVDGGVPEAELIVCSDGLRKSDKTKIQACTLGRPVTFIDMPMSRVRHLRTVGGWPHTVYARLLLPDLIGKPAGRLLYLDCDIVVRDSLRPLLEIDLRGKPLAGVGSGANEALAEKLGVPIGSLYINSGVLLFDLEKWHSQRLGARILTWASENGHRLKAPDQDAICGAAHDLILPLDRRWNLTGKSPSYEGAAIIHFTNGKPLSDDCQNPALPLYLAHLAHTPWAGRPRLSKRRRKLRNARKRLERYWRKLLSSTERLLPTA